MCVFSVGDVERAQELVFNSRGIQRARDLAAQHAELAVQAVSSHILPRACAIAPTQDCNCY